MAGPEVGSVYIRVKAITDKVAPDIQKAFAALGSDSSIAKSGNDIANNLNKSIKKGVDPNVFSKIGTALSDFGGEAGSARETLFSLTKTFNIAGTSGATLIGALSSLVGGLGGLAGAALGAVPAVMGLVGAFVSLKVGMSVGELALGGVMDAVQKATKQQSTFGLTLAETARKMRDLQFASEDAALAEKRAALDLEKARNNLVRTQDMPASSMARREALQAYKEAELNLRKAKDKNKNAAEDQAGGVKTPKAGQDPFAGLTPSQKDFAKFLISIQGKMKELTEEAAKGFLPTLKKNIQTLLKSVFPTFKTGIGEISTGLAGLTTNVTNALADPANVKLLGEVMHNIAGDLPIIGEIIGSVYGVFLSILKGADPLVKRFLNFLKTKVKGLDEWLKTDEGINKMASFFTGAERIMGELGVIFNNTLGGLGAIIGANFYPGSGGDIMLQWLKDVTGDWAAMDDTVKGRRTLFNYFRDTAINSTKILDATGALVGELLKLGTNQNIGKTFEAMADPAAVAAMGELGKKLVDAGPSMGRLVADIVIFINKMTDTKAIENFFNTIDEMVKLVNKALDDPVIKAVFDTLGQIHGVVYGIAVGAQVLGFGFKYVGEVVDQVSGFFEGVGKVVDGVKTGIENIKTGISVAKDIGGKVAEGFTAVKSTIADAATFAKTQLADLGKKGLEIAKTAGSAFLDWGKQMGTYVAGGAKAAAGAIGDLSKKVALNTVEIVKNIAQWVAQKAALIASKVATLASNIATGIATGVQAAFNAVMALNPIILIAAAIALVVAGLVLFFTQTEVGKKAWGDFMNFMKDVWENITGFFSAAWDWLKENWPLVLAILTGPIGLAVKWIVDNWSGITKTFNEVFKNVGKFASDVWKNITKGLSDFAGSVGKGLAPVFGFFKTVFNNVSSFFKTVINGLISMAENFVNFWIRGINNIVKAFNTIKFKVPDWIPLIGGKNFGFAIPTIPEIKLPRLAKGGVVMPSAGGTLAQIAEAGKPERVEPLDPNGLSNRDKAMIDFLTKGSSGGARPIQVNVYPSAGMDEKDLAAVVSRQLAFELRRGGY